jgi:hypothetical protein
MSGPKKIVLLSAIVLALLCSIQSNALAAVFSIEDEDDFTPYGSYSPITVYYDGYESGPLSVHYEVFAVTTDDYRGFWCSGNLDLNTGFTLWVPLQDLTSRRSNDTADPDIRFEVILSEPVGAWFEGDNYISDYTNDNDVCGDALFAYLTVADDEPGIFVFDEGDGYFHCEVNDREFLTNSPWMQIFLAYTVTDGTAEFGTDFDLRDMIDPETSLGDEGWLEFTPEQRFHDIFVVPGNVTSSDLDFFISFDAYFEQISQWPYIYYYFTDYYSDYSALEVVDVYQVEPDHIDLELLMRPVWVYDPAITVSIANEETYENDGYIAFNVSSSVDTSMSYDCRHTTCTMNWWRNPAISA